MKRVAGYIPTVGEEFIVDAPEASTKYVGEEQGVRFRVTSVESGYDDGGPPFYIVMYEHLENPPDLRAWRNHDFSYSTGSAYAGWLDWQGVVKVDGVETL